MTPVQEFIDSYTLALIALAFSIYSLSVLRVTSFNVMTFGAILLHLLHSQIQRTLVPMFGVEEYAEVIGVLWFWSYAITDFVFVYLIISITKRFSLPKDRVTFAVLGVYIFLGLVQITRHIEFELGSSYLFNFYSNSVVLSNIVVMVFIMTMAIRALLVRTGRVILNLRG